MSRCFVSSLAVTTLLLAAAVGHAETTAVPFDSERWTIRAAEHSIGEHLGQTGLHLRGGIAVIEDVDFLDGILEFDLAMSGERGFIGAVWRFQDGGNYEHFYVRPHQSGNPDANQYTPVWSGVSAWQLYHGEGYSTPVSYPFDRWVHVKIVISGGRGEVYIDSQEPVLQIPELKRDPRSGKIGVNAGGPATAVFANFRYEKLDAPPLVSAPRDEPVMTPGIVKRWAVSNAFDGASLEEKYVLGAADKKDLNWETLAAERSGIANLARIGRFGEGRNTVFARLEVHAESAGVRKLRFGYSDAVRLYFNDRLIYGGSNLYRSRDYRYLGTIGLFDEVYLPLEKGQNELWLAVTESFGGWGVQALFEETDGLRFEP